MNTWKRENYIQKRKRKIFIIPIFLLFLFLTGCAIVKEESSIVTVEIPKDATKLYYLNEERTKVISEVLVLEMSTIEEQISEALTILEEVLWTEEEKQLVSDSNPIQGFILNQETGVITLYFASDYSFTHSITETLRRAAIVKTLCQIRKVTSIEIYIGSQPLMLANGKPVGLMTANNFMESTGANTEFFQEIDVSVYFADTTGNFLVKSDEKVVYNGVVSTERLILNQLIKGPLSTSMRSVIPEGTILNKVITQDGICYVDFSEQFMKTREGISPEVAIYAVVNSLTQLPNVHKVQFLIDGTIRKSYEQLDFSSYFEQNLDIIDGEQ